jgi:predicted PurR-regulated permease PerM
MPTRLDDLTQTLLAALFVLGLLAGTFWILWPFIPAIIWAVTLVIATWPIMLTVQRALGGRRSLAVFAMTSSLLVLLIVPLWLAISTIAHNAGEISALVRRLYAEGVPLAPAWVAGLPLIGQSLAESWNDLASESVQTLAPRLTPYAGGVTRWLLSATGSLGGTLLQFILVVFIAAILYSGGEGFATAVLRFGHRLGGDRGRAAVRLTGQAIRGVALGVVVTAVLQSAVGGIGLALAGVPFAAVLIAVMFLLCLAQIGPAPVLIPAVIWLYAMGHPVSGTVLLVFGAAAMTMDSVVRPVLIRRGVDLPMLLIIAGVIGGLLALGLLGIFIGPAVLAVSYTLLNAWIAEDDTMRL